MSALPQLPSRTERVMGEVLFQGGAPAWVWEDHAAILETIRDRDGDAAEALARRHAEHGEQLILDAMGEAATGSG